MQFLVSWCSLIKEHTERMSSEKPRRQHARGAEYRDCCQQREAQQDSQLTWGLEEEQECQFSTVLQNLNGNKMAQIPLKTDEGQNAIIDLSPVNSPLKNLFLVFILKLHFIPLKQIPSQKDENKKPKPMKTNQPKKFPKTQTKKLHQTQSKTKTKL